MVLCQCYGEHEQSTYPSRSSSPDWDQLLDHQTVDPDWKAEDGADTRRPSSHHGIVPATIPGEGQDEIGQRIARALPTRKWKEPTGRKSGQCSHRRLNGG